MVPTDDDEAIPELAPDPTHRGNDEPYKLEFLRICATCCLLDEEFVLALGFDTESPTSVLVREPGCADRRVSTVSNRDDILALVDVEDELWPRSAHDEETLRRALQIWHRRHAFSADPFIYEISFASPLRRSPCEGAQQPRGRPGFDRATLDANATGSRGRPRHPTTRNASWAGPTVRRFRARGPRRIHYERPSAGAIRFIDYYPEGKHDVGLRAKD